MTTKDDTMASNENTPESVLNAPKGVEEVIHATAGPSRRERRYMRIARVMNMPYVDPVKRQAKAERLEKKAARRGNRG